MERAGLVTSGTEGAAPRIPRGEKEVGGTARRSEDEEFPGGGLRSAFRLTLFASDGPVEEGVEEQLEGSGVSQAVENLEDIRLGEKPFPTIQRLKNQKTSALKTKMTDFQASPIKGHPEISPNQQDSSSQNPIPSTILPPNNPVVGQGGIARPIPTAIAVGSSAVCNPAGAAPARQSSPPAERPLDFGNNRRSCSEFRGGTRKCGNKKGICGVRAEPGSAGTPEMPRSRSYRQQTAAP